MTIAYPKYLRTHHPVVDLIFVVLNGRICTDLEACVIVLVRIQIKSSSDGYAWRAGLLLGPPRALLQALPWSGLRMACHTVDLHCGKPPVYAYVSRELN